MKALMEQYAEEFEWGFDYGRSDYNNLIENIDLNKVYLVMDPIKRKRIKNQLGATTGYRYRGYFMLLYKSDLDELYSGSPEAKHEKYIAPLYLELDKLEDKILGCDVDYLIEWEATEIVNVFSENMDGLNINYTITHKL